MGYKSFKDKIKPRIPTFVSIYRSLRSCLKRFFTGLLAEYILMRSAKKRRPSFGKELNAKDRVQKIVSDHWANYKTDLHPQNRRMRPIGLKEIGGMGTENTSFLINEIVRVFAPNGTYLEVGTFQGYSLLSAALYNSATRCIAIDDFSQFDPEHENKKIFLKNLKKFRDPGNIEFHDMNYREAMTRLFSKEPGLSIDVYFYDGEHSYENQSEGLRIMLPHLSGRCVILVDDINWESVERANKEFVAEHPEFKSVFKIKTEGNRSETWWNGFEVLVRGS